MTHQIGRNDSCHCGSGKKYKKCHLDQDAKVQSKEREKASLNKASLDTEKKEAAPSHKDELKKPTALSFLRKFTKPNFFGRTKKIG